MRSNPNTKYFFNPVQVRPKDEHEAKAYEKAKADSLATWNRIGWRELYLRLAQLGSFGTLKEDIMKASMLDVVLHLSINNGS